MMSCLNHENCAILNVIFQNLRLSQQRGQKGSKEHVSGYLI